MKNQIIKISLLTPVFLLFIMPIMAQGPGAPVATPIDGGLSWLLAAAGVYGFRKIYKGKSLK